MAIAQNNFTLYRGKAYEGQISTTEICEVVSRVVENSLIEFGRAVARGVNTRSCSPVNKDTTANEIIGFSVRTMAEYSTTPPNREQIYKTGYEVEHVASILRRGPIFVMCVDGANAGDTVSVILTPGENQGRLTTGAGEGRVELKQVHWVENVSAGEIGEIRVDGILTV